MKKFVPLLAFCLCCYELSSQDTSRYKLRLDLPLFESAQNLSKPYGWPSMNQALGWSSSLYDLSFYGIHRASALLWRRQSTPLKRAGRKTIEYAAQLLFARYASELPVPLGIWAHEEFHRSVLKTAGIYSHNGNWLPERWDGTVYGVSDQQLKTLKSEHPEILLYSYVAGVHAELAQNKRLVQEDFSYRRHYYKSALILYNSWYVYNYFSFATSALSDSVARIAPRFESESSRQRDFAGADLTSWVWDMYTPGEAYDNRKPFPGGEGVNRRIGFSELSKDGQTFLLEQKKLSLLNFINPSILGVHRIQVGEHFSFLPFVQYFPLHFGNCRNLTLLLSARKMTVMAAYNQYNNLRLQGHGAELGARKEVDDGKTSFNAQVNWWQQPDAFQSSALRSGFSCHAGTTRQVTSVIFLNVSADYKTRGWLLGNPYLDSRFSLNAGISIVTK